MYPHVQAPIFTPCLVFLSSSLVVCAPAFLGTVFNVFPIARPFLAPFKGQAAGCADLGRKAVLGLCDHFFLEPRCDDCDAAERLGI